MAINKKKIGKLLGITATATGVVFVGLVLLSPFMGASALAIKPEDLEPILFSQKRVGQNKLYFKLHKFRSMKMCMLHDVPTHMLDNPDQCITKVGKLIRTHSLDGSIIIRQTTKNVVNTGFCEVSPIHFFKGHAPFSTNKTQIDYFKDLRLAA
jgi:hypothetical protein